MKISKKFVAVMLLIAVAALGCIGFAACNDTGGDSSDVRMVMPDGTPALSVAKLFSSNKTIAGKKMTYEIVPANSLASELNQGKAQVIIMPTNTGVEQIIKNKLDYRLFSVCVEGNLYVVGNPAKVNGSAEITLNDLRGKKVACIGQGGTPDLIFRYIVDNTEGFSVGEGGGQINIQYVSEAPQAKTALVNGTVDFAIVGEPAATAFGTEAGGGFSARLDLQKLYEQISGYDMFPQASMFIKTSLIAQSSFINELKNAMISSVDWVKLSTTIINAYMKDEAGSATTFPPSSIARCNICAKFMDDENVRISMLGYLDAMKVDLGIFA